MDDRVIELWLRYLGGQTLSDSDKQALLQALETDESLRSALLRDERFHGWMIQAGRSERDADAFVQQCLARVHAERTGEPFVERVQERLDGEVRSRVVEKKNRFSPRLWAPLAAAASLLVAVGMWWLQPRGEGRGTREVVVAKVVEKKSEVKSQRSDSGWIELKAGDAVSAGERVRTGSGAYAKLVLGSSDTELTLRSNTELTIKGGGEASQTGLEQGRAAGLQIGKVEVVHNRKGSPFAVETELGVARAVGTTFSVEMLNRNTKDKEMRKFGNVTGMVMVTMVTSGIVGVSNQFGALEARAGDEVVVSAGKAPEAAAPAAQEQTVTGKLTKEDNRNGMIRYFVATPNGRKVELVKSSVKLDEFVDKDVTATGTRSDDGKTLSGVTKVVPVEK